MEFTYSGVQNLSWAHPTDRTRIQCWVNWDHVVEETWSPCLVVQSGDLDHIHEIFARCVAGDFGEIGDYIQMDNIPTTVDGEPVALNMFVRPDRNALLADCDYIMAADVWSGLSSEKQQEWITYRQALRDLPSQPAYANLEGVFNPDTMEWQPSVTIDWPTKPA